METDADRLAMIKGLGGQLVRHNAGCFWAIFDNDFIEVLDSVESRAPSLMCRSIDAPMTKDDVLQVGADSYRVRRIEQDGTGMARVVLKR